MIQLSMNVVCDRLSLLFTEFLSIQFLFLCTDLLKLTREQSECTFLPSLNQQNMLIANIEQSQVAQK